MPPPEMEGHGGRAPKSLRWRWDRPRGTRWTSSARPRRLGARPTTRGHPTRCRRIDVRRRMLRTCRPLFRSCKLPGFAFVVAFPPLFLGLLMVKSHVLTVVGAEQGGVDGAGVFFRRLHMDRPADGHVRVVDDTGRGHLLVIGIRLEYSQVSDERGCDR